MSSVAVKTKRTKKLSYAYVEKLQILLKDSLL